MRVVSKRGAPRCQLCWLLHVLVLVLEGELVAVELEEYTMVVVEGWEE